VKTEFRRTENGSAMPEIFPDTALPCDFVKKTGS
jgi:hypothetical protein